MDKAKAARLRAEVNEALAAVGIKNGMSFSLGNITFTDQDMRVTIRGIEGDSSITPMALDWEKYKHRYPELSKADLGNTFLDDKGNTFKIVGLKPRNRKYPVIAERVDTGRNFKFSSYQVNLFLSFNR